MFNYSCFLLNMGFAVSFPTHFLQPCAIPSNSFAVTWGFPVGLSHSQCKPMYRIRFNQRGFLHLSLGQEYGSFSGALIGDLSSH